MLKRMSREEKEKYYYDLLKKHQLSLAVGEKFLAAYRHIVADLESCPIFGNAFEYGHTRPSTRAVYENTTIFKSGLITPRAKEILYSKMLDKAEKKKLLTDDHVLSPQTYAYFMIYYWYEIFHNNLDIFFKHMKLISTTIVCTREENTSFSKFTVNNEETEKRIRLKVKTEDRYKEAGINKLFSKKEGKYIFGFPIDLTNEFLSFEKEYLLL